jgi:steroid 5-alpha reductase family enzyme
MGRWQWELFALLFVAGFQNVLLLLITLPAWAALEGASTQPGGGVPFGPLDAVATLLFLAFLAGETIADEQQWRFHQDKKARLARGEALERPFLTTGLFAWSRHPNFFCEQAIWWCLCLFAVSATGRWLDASFVGAAVLTALFQGSTRFTEEISLSKYPSYAEYQKRTSRLWPLPPKAR